MGCFLSTQNPRTTKQQQQQPSQNPIKKPNQPNQQPIISKSPPPDEESVKEVLSETPKPKPNITKPPSHFTKTLNPSKKTPSLDKLSWESSFKPSSDDIVSDYSSCCFGDTSFEKRDTSFEKRDTSFEKRDTILTNSSVAATNTAISPIKPNNNNNNGSPMRNPKKGSYSGELIRDNASTGRSPVRRLDPSPGRRNEGGNGLKRNARSEIDPSKGSGSGSGRRSRSPGNRTEAGCGGDGGNLGRSHSGRKRGSPGRIRLVGGGGGGGSGKWGGGMMMPNESLENPLVSLECFIFL